MAPGTLGRTRARSFDASRAHDRQRISASGPRLSALESILAASAANDRPEDWHAQCALVNSRGRVGEIRLLRGVTIMSASHRATDIHLRRHRTKKRNKLRARIAAAPVAARAALEARVLRTYSVFHTTRTEKPPPEAV